MIDFLSFGYFGVFLFSFLLNMLPFMSPSNLIIAGVAGMNLYWAEPLIIGFLIAVAASLAKLIHFFVTFLVGKAMKVSESRLEGYRHRANKIGPALIFLAAVSPVPDDPVVIPLGLMKYNPLKFFAFYFAGKMIVTTLGASVGSSVSLTLVDMLGSPLLAVLSVALTLAATYILTKVNLEDLTERVLDKLKRRLLGRLF